MRHTGIRTLLLMLLCVCMLSAAVADECVCPNCGYTWDPDAEDQATAEEIEAALEGAVYGNTEDEDAADDEDASPVVVSSDVTVSKGIVKVTWTDPGDNGPYSVYYDNGYGTGVENWTYGGSNITGKSFYFGKDYTDYLVPGRTYRIRVADNNWKYSYAVIEVPNITKKFESGKYNSDEISASVKLLYKAADSFSSEYKTVKTFSASAMKKHIEESGDVYTFEYNLKFTYGKGKTFPYFVTVTAPNGYAECVSSSSYGVWFYKKSTHSMTVSNYFFKDMLDSYGEIPAGKYTIRLYLDGMLANTKTFTVE